jgi:hypothetical protein
MGHGAESMGHGAWGDRKMETEDRKMKNGIGVFEGLKTN